MRRFFACLFLAIFGIVLVVVAGIFFLSKYAMLMETVDDVEISHDPTLVRAPPGDLDIYTPVKKQVFFENRVILEGKTAMENILVLIDGKDPRALSVDQDGRFKKNLTLHRGVNQITVVATDGEKELSEELVVGFYPDARSGNYTAFMGQTKNVEYEDRTFEVIVLGIGDTSLKADGSTKFFEVSESGKETAVSISALENTQRVGVIAARGSKGALSPKDVRIALYPYNYFGNVANKQANSFILDLGRGEKDVSVIARTEVFKWQRGNLKSISFGSLKVGDRVFVTGFIPPHQPGTKPTANFILVL